MEIIAGKNYLLCRNFNIAGEKSAKSAIRAIKMKWRCVIWQAAKRKILQQQFWEK